MRNMLQIVGGVAAAGVIAAASTALTGTGLTRTTTADTAEDRWIGGTVTQTITGGANVESITYTFADAPANTRVATAVITVSNAASKYLSFKPTAAYAGSAAKWVCSATSAWVADGSGATSVWTTDTAKLQLAGTPASVTCAPALANGTATSQYVTALSAVEVGVTVS